MSQVDDLNALLAAIASDVTAVLDQVRSLEEQLTTLQQTTPPQVDLSGAIAAATAIREQLEATSTSTGGDASGGDTSGTENPPADGSGSTDQTP
jgi:hypothetical protein